MTQWSTHPLNHTQWYHDGPFDQENKRLMPNALHFPLNTTLSTSKHLKCFPNFISVEGHTDWITVTVLMCEFQVSVTGCLGHNDLNENQTTLLLSGAKCWGHNGLMWLPLEPPPLRNHSTLGLTLVNFHPSGLAQSMTISMPILHTIPGHALHSAGRTGTRSLLLL